MERILETKLKAKARLMMWFQFALATGILIGPSYKSDFGFSQTPLRIIGLTLFLPAAAMFIRSLFALGKSLTPDPVPKSNAVLVVTGPYRFVRHPLYTTLILMVLGWSLYFSSVVSLILSALLIFVLNQKAAYEEFFLREKFPEYDAYMKRVGRLFPRLPRTRKLHAMKDYKGQNES